MAASKAERQQQEEHNEGVQTLVPLTGRLRRRMLGFADKIPFPFRGTDQQNFEYSVSCGKIHNNARGNTVIRLRFTD